MGAAPSQDLARTCMAHGGTSSVSITGCGSPRQEVTSPLLVGDKSLRSRPLHGVPSSRVMAVLGQGTWHLSHLLKHEASLCSEKKDAGSEDQVFDAPVKNNVWAGDVTQSVELLTEYKPRFHPQHRLSQHGDAYLLF